LNPFIRAMTILVATLAITVAHAAPESRVALVLGNARYPDAPLKNAANDARAMATTLRERGFDVILRVDANKQQMEAAVIEFGEKLSEGATGLFFFAGHGMQVQGRNFLVPIDAKLTTEQRVKVETVDVDVVLDQMQGARSKVNVVILDACRNNPFERRFRSASGGLAQINAPEGTLIAYATAPGRVAADGEGANGLYTAELLKALRAPGLKVEDVFKQVRINVARSSNGAQTPWEASSLVGDFYFIPPAPVAAAVPANSVELGFWNSIQNTQEPGEYRAYLTRYPKGEFVELAQMRLAAIEKARVDAVTRASAEAAEKSRAEAAAEKSRIEIEKVRLEAAEKSRLEVERVRQEAAERSRMEIERMRLAAASAPPGPAAAARTDTATAGTASQPAKETAVAALPSPLAPAAPDTQPSEKLTAMQKLARGIPVTYADLEGRQFFAQQSYRGGHRGFEIKFDFSGRDPGRIMVYGNIDLEIVPRHVTNVPHVTCPIYGFDRFKQNLQFTAYCNGSFVVMGDLSTMSANFYHPGIGPAATVVDAAFSDQHKDWSKGAADNNTTIFFESVIKGTLRNTQQANLSSAAESIRAQGFDGTYNAKFTVIGQDGFAPMSAAIEIAQNRISGTAANASGTGCTVAGELEDTGVIKSLSMSCRRANVHFTGRFEVDPRTGIVEGKTEARSITDGRVIPVVWQR